MIHHVSIQVSELAASAQLYDAMLGALGYVRAWTADREIGYGSEPGKDKFAIKERGPEFRAGPGHHVAFAARDRASVDRFHEAALAAGARSNGAAGRRPHYGEHYYAAFVIDLDGNHVEAVCSSPERG